jgi:hypothetical protein
VHHWSSLRHSNALVREAFPDSNQVQVFGFDWLGRQFAVDSRGRRDEDPAVLLFEPGTGEVLEICAHFSMFHDGELIEFKNEALASHFFAQWRAAAGASVGFSECVGYRVPLFLGGKDQVDNLEIIDLDVYWTIVGQLRTGSRKLPKGTTIRRIATSD